MSLNPELRLYDAAGERQPLPSRFVLGWDFELLSRGGCGTFSLTLRAGLQDAELPAMPEPGGRFEVRFGSKCAYRGRIDRVRPPVDEAPERVQVDGAGLMVRTDAFLVDCAYAKPYGADARLIFAWLAGKFAVGSERLGDLVQSIEAVPEEEAQWIKFDRAEFFGSTLRQAFDHLAEAAEDGLIWGFDVTPAGNNRLYVRSRPTSVLQEDFRFRVGKDVTFLEDPQDLAELANAVRLVGGAAKAPNLAYNASFELPAVPGDGKEGNLLKNPSFGLTTGWTFVPDVASIRQTSDGEPGEYARTGGQFAELDNAGDLVRQTITPPTVALGTQFKLQLHYAKQDALTDGVFRVQVLGRNSGDSATTETLVDENVTASARSYQEKEWTFQIADGGTARFRVILSYVSGGSCLLDDVYLFESGILVQDGWTSINRGTGSAVLDWALDADPYHGCYAVQAVTKGCSDSGNANTVRIQQTNEHWLSARDKTAFIFRVWVRTGAGLKLRLGLQRQKDTGGADYHWAATVTTSGAGDWELIQATITTGSSTAIRPIIELRGNGTYELDAVQVFESGLDDSQGYIDGENYQYSFRVDEAWTERTDLAVHASNALKVASAGTPFAAADVGLTLRITGGVGWTAGDYRITAVDGSSYAVLSTSPAATSTTGGVGIASRLPGLSSSARSSIVTYGLHEVRLEVDEIDSEDAARRYVTGYLNRYAVPLRQGKLTLEHPDVFLRFVDDDADATTLGMVSVAGLAEPLEAQFPVRISYAMDADGVLRCELELTNRRPDPALLLKKALGGSAGGTGGGGGGGTNLKSTPGNSVSGGANGVVSTYRVDDTTIGSRGTLNLKAGAGVTISGLDDETDDEVEATISASVPLAIKEGGAGVVANAGALDFVYGFDVTESPSGEGNIALDLDGELHLRGLLAARPAAGAVPAGVFYLATDVNGGTHYRNNGSSWDQLGAGVSEVVSGAGPGPTLIGVWAKDDITNLTGSPDELYSSFSKGSNDQIEEGAGFAGSLRRLVLTLSGDVGGAGVSVTAEVYINGVASGFSVTLNGGVGTERVEIANASAGTYPFNPTDLITVYATKSGAVGARKMTVRVYGS